MYYITIVSISILQTNKEWLHLFTKLLNCGLQEKITYLANLHYQKTVCFKVLACVKLAITELQGLSNKLLYQVNLYSTLAC